MKHFVDNVVNRRRFWVPLAVALILSMSLASMPAARVDDFHGISSDGAPDILLLVPPVELERLTGTFHPGGALTEMRSAVLTESVREVLARYPRFLEPDEQESLALLLMAEGERNDIDPLFLAAVIRVESAFSADAISDKGARGLMQVMPATGAEMSQKLGLNWKGPNTLHDPEMNLKVGSFYLRRLLDRYRGSYKRALTAYNRGPRNVRHIERRHGRLQPRFTGYFRKIQEIYKQYQRNLGVSAALLHVG